VSTAIQLDWGITDDGQPLRTNRRRRIWIFLVFGSDPIRIQGKGMTEGWHNVDDRRQCLCVRMRAGDGGFVGWGFTRDDEHTDRNRSRNRATSCFVKRFLQYTLIHQSGTARRPSLPFPPSLPSLPAEQAPTTFIVPRVVCLGVLRGTDKKDPAYLTSNIRYNSSRGLNPTQSCPVSIIRILPEETSTHST